jgi:hypothetical protein
MRGWGELANPNLFRLIWQFVEVRKPTPTYALQRERSPSSKSPFPVAV